MNLYQFSQYGVLFGWLFLIVACSNGQSSSTEEMQEFGIPEIDKLTEEIKKHPDDPRYYAARSELLGDKGMYKKAELDAERAFDMDSTNPDYHRLLINAYFDNGNSRKAVKMGSKALERFPEDEKLFLNVAEIQLITQQYNDALITLDNMLKVAPFHPDALFLKGMAYKEMKDTLKALDHFQAAVEQNPNLLDAYMELGLLSTKVTNENIPQDIAVQYFNNVLRIDSLYEDALLEKAKFYHFRGEFDEALKQYEQAILKQPQSANINFNLANMHMEMAANAKEKGQTEDVKMHHGKAFQHYDNATKFDPQFADAYYFKGLSAEMLGKKAVALQAYQNAMRQQSLLRVASPADVDLAIRQLEGE